MPEQRSIATPYDALLLLSFGGPEGPDDVVPFLENVTRGRGIPKERLKEVGQHYFLFGGVSPINDQNRALLDALRKDFAEHGLDLPVYWGNRNWAPVPDRHPARDGRRRPPPHRRPRHQRVRLVLRLPPVPREPRRRARRPGGRGPAELPRVDKLRHYFNHPGFVRAHDRRRARRRSPSSPRTSAAGAHLAFTTHSIPTAAADTSGPGRGRTATAARTSPSTWTSPG